MSITQEGEAMKYKDGVTYDFTINDCTVHVRLKNFRPEVIQNFNKALAKEKWRCYHEQEAEKRRCTG